jgi:hypothetical protein
MDSAADTLKTYGPVLEWPYADTLKGSMPCISKRLESKSDDRKMESDS